eukprot:1326243-Amorphochlora_amoeboformis.AAC.1
MAKTVTKVEDTKTLKAVKDKAVWSIEERNDAGPVPWIPIWLHWPLFAFPYFANDWSARFVGMQVVRGFSDPLYLGWQLQLA